MKASENDNVDRNDIESDYVNSFYGENEKKEIDLLLWITFLVFDLTDRSNKYASFLMITLKFRYHCVYIFHVTFPEKTIWRYIISQTNIFNIFSVSVPLNFVKKYFS